MKTRASTKKPKNLNLSEGVVRKGEALRKVMNRTSLSNVVEVLIEEEHKRVCKSEAA